MRTAVAVRKGRLLGLAAHDDRLIFMILRTPSSAPVGCARLLVVGLPGSPVNIPGLVLPECAIWADLNLPVIFFGLPGGTSWSMNVSIPNNPCLVGIKTVAQAAYAPGLVLSNGVQSTVGN